MNNIKQKKLKEYRNFKVGDSVKRVTGTDVYGNPWNTEGVILEIRQWESGKVYFIVAENGDVNTQVILFPRQIKKIKK